MIRWVLADTEEPVPVFGHGADKLPDYLTIVCDFEQTPWHAFGDERVSVGQALDAGNDARVKAFVVLPDDFGFRIPIIAAIVAQRQLQFDDGGVFIFRLLIFADDIVTVVVDEEIACARRALVNPLRVMLLEELSVFR